MADGNLTAHQPWRRPDEGADTLVLASWMAVVALAFFLMRPPAPPETEQFFETRPAQVAAASAEPGARLPQYYPWVRPGGGKQSAEPNLPFWSAPEKPRTGGFYTRLGAPLEDAVFSASNHSNAESFYGGDWTPDNIATRGGGAYLEVRRTPERDLPYTAGEMQSRKFYQYGRYEAIMQPASGSGLVTAFFTYTGPWFKSPHDEIDIEFLGADTTKIHFNYFRNGRSIKPATFDLPFDAAAAPRLYAFEWRPDGITWFVEGEAIYSTVPGDPGVPVSPGKVMFSAWTGKPHMQGWHGVPSFRDGSGAAFQCVSFTPLGHDTPKCSDSYGSGSSGMTAGQGH